MARTSEARKLEEKPSRKKTGRKKSGNYVCEVCGNSITFDDAGREENEDLICCGQYMREEED